MALLEYLNKFQLNKMVVARPSLNGMEKSAKKIEKQAEGLDEVNIKPSQAVIDLVIQQLRGNLVLERKSLKLMASGGLEYFEKLPDGDKLFQQFLKSILNAGSTLVFKSLLLGYLRISHDEFPLISNGVRKFLIKNIENIPDRWLLKVKKYEFLGEDVGRNLSNQLLLNQNETIDEILKDSGLNRGFMISGGFVKQVFKRTCEEVSKGHRLDTLNRFFELLEENCVGEPQFPFVQKKSGDITAITQALLNPYLNEIPDTAVKERIENFLLDRFQDPRVNASRWNRVDERYRAVLSRWLTKESFELLMKVLSKTNEKKQWVDRSKFWGFYIDNDLVSDAWVAFGPDAFSLANSMVENGTLKSKGAYAKLEKSNIESIHSVIFMKIGDLTISEWTHDGKVRIYSSSNSRAPKFYLSRYSPPSLRSDHTPDYRKSHLGYWQGDVEEYIYQQTGIKGPNKSRGTRKSKNASTNSLDTLGQASCNSCGAITQERWLTPDGKCMSCAGNKVRTR
jgi:hypothetical protein